MAHTERAPGDIVLSRELLQLIPYSLNHIRRLEAAGGFPRRFRLGPNRVGWARRDINAWLNERMGGTRPGCENVPLPEAAPPSRVDEAKPDLSDQASTECVGAGKCGACPLKDICGSRTLRNSTSSLHGGISYEK
jgi:prophage regulatory protein